MIELSARSIDAGYRGWRVLTDVSLDVRSGEVHGLIGPNGAGKSTLLHVLANLVPPTAGTVETPHGQVAQLDARARAKHLAFLPQDTSAHSDLTVRRVVELGRYAHQSRLARLRGIDPASHTLIDAAMDRVGIAHLAERPIDQLSGGQRQLVYIAKQLAQESRVLMLDEPVSALDLGFQLQVLSLVKELASDGRAVVVVLHDLNLAARSCDRLTVLSGGRVVASGTPRTVLTASLVGDLYGVNAVVDLDEHTGYPRVTALSATPLSAHTDSVDT